MARVLLIDDEPDVLLISRVNLTHAGHDVVATTDPFDGVELACASQPDVIVLDLMMPHLDGFGVLEQLRADVRTASIPVIVLSARVTARDQISGWRHGASEYLTKPFSPEVVVEAVQRVQSMDAEATQARRREALSALAAA